MASNTVEQTAPASLSCPPANSLSESGARGLLEKTLLLINSLSLDAPFVGVIWLWCLSSVNSSRIGFQHYLVLFSVTWLAYSGDRLLDSIRTPAKPCMVPRHLFTSMYFKPLMCIWGVVALSSILYLGLHLGRTEIIWGVSLLALLSLYYLCCFYFPNLARGLLPREMLVGLFFSSATHFFILIQIADWNYYFVWTFVCFFGLCSLNCLLISRCEFLSDQQVGEVTFFTRHPHRIHRFQSMLIWFIGLQVIACCIAVSLQLFPVFELSLLSSSVLLLVLDCCLIRPQLKPVLADLALFTPWIFLSMTA
ncbi:hypothetical protein [uncultured Gimesia sp.]|uniref:hypothetical protein n=1 Tax=uncultured Gimesia sp. TaxID=1678688 RepID=UPI0030D9C3B6|tara:strand:+ start:54021 stop:54944 length:924 start_codon:yes stop_codon:yes gene_type:complete